VPVHGALPINARYYTVAVIADVVTIAVSLMLAVYIRFGNLSAFPLSEYVGTGAFFFLGYYVASVTENLYSIRTTLNRPMLLYKTMRVTFMVTGFFILCAFLSNGVRFIFIDSRFVIVLNMFAWLFLTLLLKLLVLPRMFRSLYHGKRASSSSLLIIGNPARNQSITSLFTGSVVYAPEQIIVPWPAILPTDPDELFLMVSGLMSDKNCSGAVILFDERHDFNCIAESCIKMSAARIPFVIYGPGIFNLGYFDPWFSLCDYGALTFLEKGNRSFEIPVGRFTDIVLASVGLLLLAPLLLATALAVKLSSRGPVLFKQIRVGKDQKTFKFMKFRSMKTGTENTEAHREYFEQYANGKSAEENGDTFKLDQTSRITSVGRVIRKTSIDELPQLLNVLKGDMTIVGPRPCIPYELEHYKTWQRRRFLIKPALTGIWQVYGRSRLPFDEAQFLDFLYTIDASYSLNLRLIMKTIPVVFWGKGGL
jgi:lipopolysaccharide/colanic/teichoic acid biosynthesis glycosyltransferase